MSSIEQQRNMYAACLDGDLDKLASLLADGVSPDSRRNMDSPHVQPHEDWTVLNAAISRASLDACRLLLGAGANVELQSFGQSPLWHAIDTGYDPVIDLLLDAGADPFVSVQNDMNPFLCAVYMGKMEIVKRVVWERQLDTSTLMEGTTALHEAAKSGRADEILVFLLGHASSQEVLDKRGKSFHEVEQASPERRQWLKSLLHGRELEEKTAPAGKSTRRQRRI